MKDRKCVVATTSFLVLLFLHVAAGASEEDEEDIFINLRDAERITEYTDYQPLDEASAKVVESLGEAGSSAHVQVGKTEWKQLPPEHSHTSKFYVRRQTVPAEAAKEVIELLADVEFKTGLESVDQQSAYEFFVHANSTMFDADDAVRQKVKKILWPSFEDRVMPLIEALLPAEKLELCFSFIRRYTPKERVRLPNHFDVNAYATFIVGLNTYGEDFAGGVYVASGGTKRYYLNLGAGDGALHESDLMHGVDVFNGTRWSWIMWFRRPGTGFCSDDDPVTVWDHPSDEDSVRDPIAQLLLAQRQFNGNEDEAALKIAKTKEAMWLRKAALNGLPLAMVDLGVKLSLQDKKNPFAAQEQKESRIWLEKAAELGEPGGYESLGHMKHREYKNDPSTPWMPHFKKACEGMEMNACGHYAAGLFDKGPEYYAAAVDLLLQVATAESFWTAYEIISKIDEETAVMISRSSSTRTRTQRHVTEVLQRDGEEHIGLLKMAAKLGHTEAQVTWSQMLLNEYGIDPEADDATFQAGLASNTQQAKVFLQKAAAVGDEKAERLLARLSAEDGEENEHHSAPKSLFGSLHSAQLSRGGGGLAVEEDDGVEYEDVEYEEEQELGGRGGDVYGEGEEEGEM